MSCIASPSPWRRPCSSPSISGVSARTAASAGHYSKLVGWAESSRPTMPYVVPVGLEDSAHPTAGCEHGRESDRFHHGRVGRLLPVGDAAQYRLRGLSALLATRS